MAIGVSLIFAVHDAASSVNAVAGTRVRIRYAVPDTPPPECTRPDLRFRFVFAALTR